MGRASIRELYYVTHIDNVPSILEQGILCHERVLAENISFTRIYDEQIVENRRSRQVPDGRSLWSFANLYFQPRNAMLFKVLRGKSPNKIVILGVRPDILNRSDIFISTGNTAHSLSDILTASEGKKVIYQIKKDTDKQFGRRKSVLKEK